MRRYVLIALSLAASLFAAGSAQAIEVNDGGTYAGVALVPGARGNPLPGGVSAVTSVAPCNDPWLSSDLGGPLLPSSGLCYHGGSVVHKNEMFALTWDAKRAYWAGTRGYVEQFLRDVADGSGTLSSPYAVTQQYQDAGGRAQNTSAFGGGCIDFGAVGGATCEFGTPTGVGHDFPLSGCPATGDSFTATDVVTPNSTCLTDSQLRGELATMVNQTGIIGRTQSGYTPVVNLLMPPGVDVCLDSASRMCSANSSLTPPPAKLSTNSTGGSLAPGTYRVEITYVTASGESLPSSAQAITTTGTTSTITIDSPPTAPGATGWNAYVTQPGGATYTAQQGSPNAIGTPLTLSAVSPSGAAPPNGMAFCSYHSQVNVGGTGVAYVVQPWTAGTTCDEPDAPSIPATPTPQELANAVGLRLASPLSQAQIAALVDPGLNGWFALDGSEVDDNHGCSPLDRGRDRVTVGSSSQNPYLLQREFNNAGVIESDPNTYFGCAPNVLLSPAFVVPSSVSPGDVVQLDGSPTASTLIVPSASYHWNFGDGATAVGPSVVHSYSSGGNYTVTLTVTDRGGNSATVSHVIEVLGANGQPVTSPTSSSGKGLRVHILLLPQGLRAVLRRGVMVRVSSNQRAAGIATVSISRALARRAHINVGRGPSVVIGVGTVSGITNGTVRLHLRLSRSMVAKLRGLHHVSLTVRLALVGAGGGHLAIDAAGRY